MQYSRNSASLLLIDDPSIDRSVRKVLSFLIRLDYYPRHSSVDACLAIRFCLDWRPFATTAVYDMLLNKQLFISDNDDTVTVLTSIRCYYSIAKSKRTNVASHYGHMLSYFAFDVFLLRLVNIRYENNWFVCRACWPMTCIRKIYL